MFVRCVMLLHEFNRSCCIETEKRFRVSSVHVWKTRAAFTFDSSRETMVGEAEYVASGIADRRRAAEQFISVMAAVWRCRWISLFCSPAYEKSLSVIVQESPARGLLRDTKVAVFARASCVQWCTTVTPKQTVRRENSNRTCTAVLLFTRATDRSRW